MERFLRLLSSITHLSIHSFHRCGDAGAVFTGLLLAFVLCRAHVRRSSVFSCITDAVLVVFEVDNADEFVVVGHLACDHLH